MKRIPVVVAIIVGAVYLMSYTLRDCAALERIVVNASKIEKLNTGRLLITTVGGSVFSIDIDDLDLQVTEALAKASRQARGMPTQDAQQTNKNLCEKEWPGDYKMQAFCLDQQNAALEAMATRNMTGLFEDIRYKCAEEWPTDFKMRDFCEKQQIEAYEKLNPR